MRFPLLLQAHLVSWCHFSTEFHTHLVASVLVYSAIVVNMYSNVSLCSHIDLLLYFTWQNICCCCLKRHKKKLWTYHTCSGVTSITHWKTSLCRMWSTCNLLITSIRTDIIMPLTMSSDSKRLILFLLSSVFYTSLPSPHALFSSSSCSSSPFFAILLITLTSPTMLTIRYLQLWNPLHQCQSGQPHRWVQRCPLQEVRGSDRLSRGGCCAWGGATEHHSMTYDPKASQLTSTPVADTYS